MTAPVAAARAAGARGAGGRATARKSTARRVAPLPPEGTRARRDRDAIDAIRRGREDREEQEEIQQRVTADAVASERRTADLERQLEQQSASPPPASPGGGLPLPAAASTGSGFLLGLFAWALGLAYLQNGSTGVKKFLAAKFLNKTG